MLGPISDVDRIIWQRQAVTVLADVLARQADWSTVGETFERLRRARVDHVQATTDKMSRLARLPTWLRDAGAQLLGPRAYREAYEALRFDPL